MRLRDRGGVVGMRVSETWQRNYQVATVSSALTRIKE